MKALIIALLAISFAYADENCEQHSYSEFSDLLDVAKQLEWEAASDLNIRNAFCIRKAPFSEAEMKAWMDSHQSPQKFNKTINGISFEGESSENLEAFNYLTTNLDFIGVPIPAKARTFRSACTKVDCALKEIFGDTGVQLMYMQRKYGMNGSHLVENNASAWKKNELDTVLLALSDYPDGVLPVKKSRPLIHAARGMDNGRTIANAVVTIYDLWNKSSPEQQRSTLTHELGHVIAGMTKLDDDPAWTSKAGWTETKKIINNKEVVSTHASKPETIVSDYGMTNSWEDLAESAVAYRYNPAALKKASPEKYALIKELIFDDVEYTSEEACQNPTRLSLTYAEKVSEQMENWLPNAEDLKRISNRCSKLAIENIFETGSATLTTPEFENCYQKAVKEEGVSRINEEIKNLPHAKFLAPMIRNAEVSLSPEKVDSLVRSARVAHSANLKNEFTKAFSGTYACNPNFNKYANQNFKNDALGIDNYQLKDKLISINNQFCDSKAKPADRAAALFK